MRTRHARQACEPCRRRKVRCDTGRPVCGNCRASELACEYSSQRRKRGPKPRTSSATESRKDKDDPDSSTILEPTNIQAESNLSAQVLSSLASPTPARCLIQSPPVAGPFPQEDTTSTSPPPQPHGRAQQIHEALMIELKSQAQPLENMVKEYINMCMLSFFPSIPVVHPPTLRRNARLLEPSSQHIFQKSAGTNGISPDISLQGSAMRDFAHITAIFACVSCRIRQTLEASRGEALIMAFLTASRDMLTCCENWDISQANSSSLVICMCHPAALHHLGKTRAPWLVMGQGIRLAMDMRLYDEDSYQSLDPLESKLRRNIFGMLRTSDMSASILNNKPLSFHDICLDETYLSVEIDNDFSLLAEEGSPFEPPYEQQVHEGFYLCQRLWKTATDIIVDMRLLSRSNGPSIFEPDTQDPMQKRIMHLYMNFCGTVDLLPAWLRNPESHIANSEEATDFQRRTFWQQKADIVVTYHCLRLTLLQRAASKGLCTLLGLISYPSMLDLRKLEVASDLASAVASIPFQALQANGEPLVEKLRQVGVILLEIAHQNENVAIFSRARSLLPTIIDIIARLDSRVSDELSTHPSLA
ncbi:C6 transcription factor [Fusarium albosuccineum]|uniref:C6 transcription factor n=1 Tax=Fusarium albosuccineum TaxID=1237068 RepID=A0A8H4P6N4_9HYPO|nr:C6 transcription factor [Fusarium albosuccineum]